MMILEMLRPRTEQRCSGRALNLSPCFVTHLPCENPKHPPGAPLPHPHSGSADRRPSPPTHRPSFAFGERFGGARSARRPETPRPCWGGREGARVGCRRCPRARPAAAPAKRLRAAPQRLRHRPRAPNQQKPWGHAGEAKPPFVKSPFCLQVTGKACGEDASSMARGCLLLLLLPAELGADEPKSQGPESAKWNKEKAEKLARRSWHLTRVGEEKNPRRCQGS